MALTAQQIKTLQNTLGTAFKPQATVVFDSKKTFTLQVAGADQKLRKVLLQQVQKTLAAAPYNATYNPPAGKSGEVSINRGEYYVKAKEAAKAGKPMFKPSDIVPSIVNSWLDPTRMVTNVKEYIQKADLATAERESIIQLLDITAKGTATQYTLPKFPRDLVPSEFFEVLSAIKLSILLKGNDAKTKKILGIPARTDMSQVKTKIYIPKQSNFPLVDYFISISPTGKESETTAIKISVKSKVSSAKTNTVKFKDMYAKASDVTKWYNELTATIKRTQKGQKIIGESVLTSYNLGQGRVGPRAPVLSLIKLIEGDRSKIESVLSQKFSVRDVNKFKTLLEFVNNTMTVTRQPNPEFGTDIKTTATQQKQLTDFIQANISDSGNASINLITFCYICDKVLVESSRETSASKYNFYQMFYDEVLKRQHVAYAVSSFKNGILSYNFYTQVNWAQEYHNWIALRNQSSTNVFNAPIGLDV
jgi:hypothetical protein